MNISKQGFIFLFVLLLCLCQGRIEGKVNEDSRQRIKQIQNPVFNLPVFDFPNGAQTGKLIFGKTSRNSGSFDNIQFSAINGEIFDDGLLGKQIN